MPSITRKLKEKRKHLNHAAPSNNATTKEQSRDLSTVEFDKRYTRNPQGFYVRNTNPSTGTLSAERIADNLRHLLSGGEVTETME